MFPEWTWLVGLYIGAAIGSFLNVVIYRTPRGMSLGNPKHSFCPKCKNQLRTIDLFPLFSWLFLRGRCRQCKAPVPARYFFVELLTGAIWAGIWWEYLIASWDPAKGVFYALAAATLVAIIFIDWELYIIPDQINAFLLFVGLGYNAWLLWQGSPAAYTWGIWSSLAGWITGVGALWGVAFLGRVLFRKDAMGHGDIKMARGIGAVLFPATALVSFGLAVVLGAVLGVAQVLIRSRGDENLGVETTVGEEGDVGLAPEDEDYPPESIGSLLKSGLGYLLAFDVVGLAFPAFYKSWFGEDPYEPIPEDDDFEVEHTMIPFGPYLALGAIVAAVFQERLLGWVSAYWQWATHTPALLEHLSLGGRL